MPIIDLPPNCKRYSRKIIMSSFSLLYYYKSKLYIRPMLIRVVRLNRTKLTLLSQQKFSHQSEKKHFFRIQDRKNQTALTVYPNQYPKNLVDNAPLVHRGRPIRFITPKDDIPENKQMSHEDVIMNTIYKNQWKSPQNAFKLNVGLIGPVNSGKSLLMSRLGHKVSAVSPKNNTTDEILNAYKSFEIEGDEGLKNVQLKYYDTPGLTHKKTGFLSKGWKVLGQIDFSLLIVDSSKKFDDLIQQSINRLQKHRNYETFMKALVLNKIDLVENKRKFHGLISQIEKYGKFDKIFYTSALTGFGVKQIEDYLIKMSKPGVWQCPKQVKTQSSELQIAQQILKQALFHRTYNQVPYEIGIECESIASKSNGADFIQFRIMVEDENVQRMIIGKKGTNINWVRDHFKTNYAKIYKRQIQIHVRVVIRKRMGMMQNEDIEDSFYKQQVHQQLKLVRQKLQKQGKIIKA